MPSSRRRDLVPRRRRREDDGEEEGSLAGDPEDDSLSEGSVISNDDDERDGAASDASGEQEHGQTAVGNAQDVDSSEMPIKAPSSRPGSDPGAQSKAMISVTADTEVMLGGLKISNTNGNGEEVHFDSLSVSEPPRAEQSEAGIPTAPRNETPAQRSRREHQEYIRQRDINPAFVPNRGGFFLHDNRSDAAPLQHTRPYGRGRGRTIHPPFQASRGVPVAEPIDKPWAHDLHDKHENVQVPPTKPSNAPVVSAPHNLSAAAAATAPNRSFSFSTVLGNVTVQVSLPGMAQKKTVPNVVKNQHTLLPQHRPPLRRDKPVRISIPDVTPRYIFPSTERSFIFIPRALRPNQQSYVRGRGRGSFHGSRRTSIFGGSAYSPSIALSRRSSLGGINRDGLRSPAESTLSRSMAVGPENPRPIVRLPTVDTPIHLPMNNDPLLRMNPMMSRPLDQAQHVNGTVSHGIHSTAIPMHQPRPQKTVSVADIESPASFSFKPPQQQQELPFHQQVPLHVGGVMNEDGQPRSRSHVSTAGGTPLSHIPETAIYAHPFQPYPAMQPPMYYGAPYGNGAAYYPASADGMPFNPSAPGMVMAPNFVPGSQIHPVQHQGAPNGSTMAHETNGMVYYFDPSQFSSDGQMAQNQFPMSGNNGMMGMGMPQVPFYYSAVPNGMFYSGQSG